MRSSIAVALGFAMIASCARGGVEVIVKPDSDSITRIELFIGVGDEMTDPIMPAMAGMPVMPISAWGRDKHNELDVRDVEAGQPVTFQFVDGTSLPIVIAVGYTADDRPISAQVAHDITFRSDAIAQYRLDLMPILNATTSGVGTLKLFRWRPTSGGPLADKTCVIVEDTLAKTREAVVTAGDPDCDGWPTGDARECQPQYFMSFARPKLADVGCLALEQVVNSTEQGCMLAGAPCTDGVGQETSCRTPSAFCTPRSVCNKCSTDPATSFDCARDPTRLAALNRPTHLACSVFIDIQTGAPCPIGFKALGMPQATIAGRTCKTDAEHPVRIIQAGRPWDTVAQFISESGSTQLTVEVKNLQSNCNFDFIPSGHIAGEDAFGAMVAAELDNGRGIAIPVVFNVSPQLAGCANQPPCAVNWPWDLSELTDQCVNTPVFPP